MDGIPSILPVRWRGNGATKSKHRKVRYNKDMFEVVIDWRCFQKGGIYRYFIEILPRIAKEPDVTLSYLGNASAVLSPPSIPDAHHLERITPKATWFPEGRIKRQLSQWRQKVDAAVWRAQLKQKKHAVFQSTHYSQAPHAGLPEVVTIHDLIPELMPEHTVGDVFDELRRDKALAIKRATYLLANSETTKRDLVKIYGVAENRVSVTPLGIDSTFFSLRSSPQEKATVREKFGLPSEPFLLYVGARLQYKNFINVLHALKHLSSHTLVAAGHPWNDEEKALMRSLGISKRVYLATNPTESELRTLYQMAGCFVYPSLYEGFGLPILEAMACGTPVVGARGGSIPEVAGDAALFCDPLDPVSIAKACEQAYDPAVAQRCVERGKNRVASYSWDETASLTVASYRKVLGV